MSEKEQRKRLELLRSEHRDLDIAIEALAGSTDQLQIARLKKKTSIEGSNPSDRRLFFTRYNCVNHLPSYDLSLVTKLGIGLFPKMLFDHFELGYPSKGKKFLIRSPLYLLPR